MDPFVSALELARAVYRVPVRFPASHTPTAEELDVPVSIAVRALSNRLQFEALLLLGDGRKVLLQNTGRTPLDAVRALCAVLRAILEERQREIADVLTKTL